MTEVKKILQKSDWDEKDYINFILEASASSPRFGVIREKEKDKYHEERGNIHTMLILPFGSGKSSIFANLGEDKKLKNYIVFAHDLTFPGLIGSINREGEVIKSSVIEAGGKLLIIDEAQRLGQDVREALCALLEKPHTYTRHLGFKLKNDIKIKRKYYYIFGKRDSNELKIYSKFSCIVSASYMKIRTSIDQAFFSRFIPIRFTPTLEWYEKLTIGEKPIVINPEFKTLDFSFEKYPEFHNYFWENLKKHPSHKHFLEHQGEMGLIPRFLQNLVRLSAFVESLDNNTEISIDTAKFVHDKFYNFIFANIVTSTLDEISFRILSYLGKLSQEEIAEKLGIDPSTVSKKIRKLKEKNIIFEV